MSVNFSKYFSYWNEEISLTTRFQPALTHVATRVTHIRPRLFVEGPLLGQLAPKRAGSLYSFRKLFIQHQESFSSSCGFVFVLMKVFFFKCSFRKKAISLILIVSIVILPCFSIWLDQVGIIKHGARDNPRIRTDLTSTQLCMSILV